MLKIRTIFDYFQMNCYNNLWYNLQNNLKFYCVQAYVTKHIFYQFQLVIYFWVSFNNFYWKPIFWLHLQFIRMLKVCLTRTKQNFDVKNTQDTSFTTKLTNFCQWINRKRLQFNNYAPWFNPSSIPIYFGT